MEGISDGGAVDDCYYCALLYPGLATCPKCANRFRYRSAQMRDINALEGDFVAAITRYQQDPSAITATELLTLWHELGEEAAPIAAASHLVTADLRHHFPAPTRGGAPDAK